MTRAINITTDVPESREVRIILPPDVPTGLVDLTVLVMPSCEASIRTLGDLRQSEFFGLWQDRSDVADSAEFARSLREAAWNRES